MDPNETLRHLREDPHDLPDTNDPDRFAPRAFVDLDEWIMKGGFLPRDWAEKCNGGLLKRALVAQSVYDAWKGSFEDGVVKGAGPFHVLVGNLMGCILRDERYLLERYPPSVREEFLRLFPGDHPVWKYIKEESDVDG